MQNDEKYKSPVTLITFNKNIERNLISANSIFFPLFDDTVVYNRIKKNYARDISKRPRILSDTLINVLIKQLRCLLVLS